MITVAAINEAEQFCRDRRLANAKLLQLDESKVGGAGELAAKMMRLAEADPLQFDTMLGKAEVAKLFACGALHFGRNNMTKTFTFGFSELAPVRYPERPPRTAIEIRQFMRLVDRVGPRRYSMRVLLNCWRRIPRAQQPL